MTIQGIIIGFANPTKLEDHILLLGHGSQYVLIEDGKSIDPSFSDLAIASASFHVAAAEKCGSDWLSIKSVIIPNVGLLSVGTSHLSSIYAKQKEVVFPLETLYALWDKLGDITTVDNADSEQVLETRFLKFPALTTRETVWHWFESQDPEFLVGEVMEGKRHQ
jgi:hypothetical protein